jgi:hypothetical protein
LTQLNGGSYPLKKYNKIKRDIQGKFATTVRVAAGIEAIQVRPVSYELS